MSLTGLSGSGTYAGNSSTVGNPGPKRFLTCSDWSSALNFEVISLGQNNFILTFHPSESSEHQPKVIDTLRGSELTQDLELTLIGRRFTLSVQLVPNAPATEKRFYGLIVNREDNRRIDLNCEF